MKWLTDRQKIDVWAEPIGGCTAVRYLPWYDMKGYSEINFVVAGGFAGSTIETTAMQNVSVQIYRATDASGGGSTAMSTATGVIAKTGTAITTVAKAKSLIISFTTRLTHASTGTAVTINGQVFSANDPGASVAYSFAGLSCAAATVAAESFITAFNNTNCTLSSAYKAEMAQTSTGLARVIIRPKTETSVGSTEFLTALVGTAVGGVGVPCVGIHLAAKTEHLRDGYRYVSLGYSQLGASLVASTVTHRQPIAVTVIRTVAESAPPSTAVQSIGVFKRTEATAL